MKLPILFLIVVFCADILCGQEKNPSRASDDRSVTEVLEEIRQQQPPDWSYADLGAKSDMIIIAKALSRSEIEWTDKLGGKFGKRRTKLLSNRLQVLSVLKGKAADKVNFFTLQWKENVVILTNFDFAKVRKTLLLPIAVPILNGGEIADYGEATEGRKTYSVEPEYLLYLRHVAGNDYVAVTGQRYSGLSVRRLK